MWLVLYLQACIVILQSDVTQGWPPLIVKET